MHIFLNFSFMESFFKNFSGYPELALHLPWLQTDQDWNNGRDEGRYQVPG